MLQLNSARRCNRSGNIGHQLVTSTIAEFHLNILRHVRVPHGLRVQSSHLLTARPPTPRIFMAEATHAIPINLLNIIAYVPEAEIQEASSPN
jgi:hypothetical protein